MAGSVCLAVPPVFRLSVCHQGHLAGGRNFQDFAGPRRNLKRRGERAKFASVFRLSEKGRQGKVVSMKPVRFEGLRQRRSSRDLPLVRLAFWLVVTAAVGLVIFVLIGLATHHSSHPPLDSVPIAD